MQNFNPDILKQNVRMLMKNNNSTQEDLAKAIGMSQSNLSKAVSKNNKKCFTVEQVFLIAQFYKVSVDWLLGGRPLRKPSPRDIGEFIVSLLSTGTIALKKITVDEEMYKMEYDRTEGHEVVVHSKGSNPYLALYFPNYAQYDWDTIDPEENDDLFFEISSVGNETGNHPVNEFLNKFFSIHKVFLKKEIDEDAYQHVLRSYLGRLNSR